jgi:23S rRNA maturation-related 3'-5' exoribonuclease YhaM
MKTEKNSLNQLFRLRQKEKRLSKNDAPFLWLELISQHKRIFGTFWKDVDIWYNKLHFNDVLNITFVLKDFNGREIAEILEINNASIKDLQESSNYIINDTDWQTYLAIKSNLKQEHQILLENVYSANDISQFFIAPAGKLWAFSKENGLMQKTFICCQIIDSLPFEVNKSLMKTAVFLQAIGYIHGFYKQEVPDYNTEAKLLGIANLALSKVAHIIEEQKISAEEKAHLLHLILALPLDHSQHFEYKSLEACLLYYVELMTLQADGLSQFINKEENTNRLWSNYNKYLERFIFIPKT